MLHAAVQGAAEFRICLGIQEKSAVLTRRGT